MKKPISQAGMKLIVEILGKLPTRIQSAIGGRKLDIGDHKLAPEVSMFLKLMGDSELSRPQNNPIEKVRNQTDNDAWVFGGNDEPVYLERNLVIKGKGGDIPARYYATNESNHGILLYFHGGAWVSGSLDSCECICRYLAKESKVHVLSVDYRLAPEHPYPAAIEDALSAYEYVLTEMASAGDPTPFIAIGGDSAGGNISASLCSQLKSKKIRQPDFQILFYPVTDNEHRSDSYRLFESGYVLTADQMNWARELYVPNKNYINPAVSPLLAGDFKDLPETYVATAEFDVLRDEGEEYAKKLNLAGSKVTLRRATGLIHGFANMMGVSRTARTEMKHAADALYRSRKSTNDYP